MNPNDNQIQPGEFGEPQAPQNPPYQNQAQPELQQPYYAEAQASFAPQAPVDQQVPVTPAAPIAPVAPVQQTQPNYFAQTTQNQAPFSAAAAKKGSKKGLIIGLIAGVSGLAIIGVAIAVLFLVLGVSKKDYSDASTKMTAVVKSYNDAGAIYLGTTSTKTEIKNGVDKINDSVDKFGNGFTELGRMKAIKNDKELKKSYEAAVAKKVKFDESVNTAVEAYGIILPAMTDYSSSSSLSSTINNITAAKKSLQGIEGLEYETNKQLVNSLVAQFEKLETLATKVQAGRDNYKLYDSSAVSEYYDTATAISTTMRDWQSNLNKLSDEGDMRDELNGLSDMLLEKSIKK